MSPTSQRGGHEHVTNHPSGESSSHGQDVGPESFSPDLNGMGLPMTINPPGVFAGQAHLFSQSTPNEATYGTNSSTLAASNVGLAANPMPSNVLDFSDFQFDDEAFLEDVLLCQFTYNPSGLTIPSTPTAAVIPVTGVEDVSDNLPQLSDSEPVQDVSIAQRVTPLLKSAIPVTADELELFHAKLTIADKDGDLSQFKKPGLSRTSRCIIAYFRYFDPHAPFVHYASFSISKTHPALVLIMLALGALHLSENDFAQSSYEASCVLLAQYEKQCLQDHDTSFTLWQAQATLLCAQYGVASGNNHLFSQAQKHLFGTHMMLGRAIEANRSLRSKGTDNWATWILLETCTRVVCWMFVVSAMCFALDPSVMTILPPMSEPVACPCDESIWHAVSETEWRAAGRLESPSATMDLWTLAKAIHNGRLPDGCGKISAFSLLAVISGQLCTICSKERLTLDIYESSDLLYISRSEQALAGWERLWRKHPRAEQSLTRLDDPLLNDCLSMLCSAYAHLYVGDELVTLKRIAENPNCGLALPQCKNWTQSLKVIRYAANSWLVRAKIGVRYLSKTKGLELGPQALSAVYESALILAWWLHLYGDNIMNSGGENYASDDERALASSVKRILTEIQDELEEQGSFCRTPGGPRLDAIGFYTSLCRDWVWECSSLIESRLRAFASYLQTRLDANLRPA
ncbi:hypothetical protein H2200_009150 [Cladophialophora chaetospira]|uniref:Xylanolytic transcriptional activator regulatory domain-containing protein n=1 Tax=Cladophialophora chaetospira TaxID=386627 RepID=A0AA39CFC3_9EURO|nr:hypothetical protein H2200_009150 [Cladophialophora chaetospira]